MANKHTSSNCFKGLSLNLDIITSMGEYMEQIFHAGFNAVGGDISFHKLWINVASSRFSFSGGPTLTCR